MLNPRILRAHNQPAISVYNQFNRTGVTYSSSPQGADHTCGLTIRTKVDHLDPKGQVDLSKNVQYNMAGYNCLGACVFAGFGFAVSQGSVARLLNERYGWDVDDDILGVLG